ncbi:hypothetical protein [Streptomyces silvensis]|uniref:Uncharacterized protein n=1 Tax=Streptomyces silvensis TaxID=1765722 RepID=A0A0W7X3P5_9ACTN|nr:hypothetical protein [Streptomyces silvensis]KUF17545.1 hypothetical protein AT728_08955 [Streptomyces silvensis]
MGNVGGGHTQESGQRLVAELLAELARRVCEVGAEHVRVVTDEELERDRMRWFRAGWQEQAREARGAREAQEARGVGKARGGSEAQEVREVREVRASRGDREIREVRGSREAHEAWQPDPGVRPAPGTPGSRPASGTSRPGPGPDPERDRGEGSGRNDRSDRRPHPATRTPDQTPTRGTGHPDTESPGTGHPDTESPSTGHPDTESPEAEPPTPGSPADPPASRARGLPEEPEHGPSRSRPARVLRFPESGGT